jgi:hypothetical protein
MGRTINFGAADILGDVTQKRACHDLTLAASDRLRNAVLALRFELLTVREFGPVFLDYNHFYAVQNMQPVS